MPLTPGFHPLTISDLRRETPDSVSLAFAVPPELEAAFTFAPGQYLTLRAKLDGVELRRAYSICAGRDDGELRVAIRHVPDGAFSHHANTALAAGDTVEVMPPAGRFGAGIAPGGTMLGLAAGSGITPILSLLRSHLAATRDSRFILLYGNRNTGAIMFRETLEDLKDRYLDRLTVIHILSREAQDIPILHGRLDAARLAALLPGLTDPAALAAAFICGPAGMIDDLTATLVQLGLPDARIHAERFTAPQTGQLRREAAPVSPDAAPVATARIVWEGRATTVPIAEDETVLEAALRAGLDLPWSCRAGMCSTCRARLAEGRVTMEQNFSLEPWELEAGYILTCQSHPLTPALVVDYDQV